MWIKSITGNKVWNTFSGIINSSTLNSTIHGHLSPCTIVNKLLASFTVNFLYFIVYDLSKELFILYTTWYECTSSLPNFQIFLLLWLATLSSTEALELLELRYRICYWWLLQSPRKSLLLKMHKLFNYNSH